MLPKYLILILVVISSYFRVYSQGIFKSSNNLIIQTQTDTMAKDDETPRQLLNAFNFDVNAKSIDYSFLQPIDKKKRKFWYGFGIEGKANNSIPKIFENENLIPSYKINGSLIYNISLSGTPTKIMLDNRDSFIQAGKDIQNKFNDLQDSLKRPKNIRLSLENKIDSLKKYKYIEKDLKELITFRDTLKVKNSKMTFVYDGIRIGIIGGFEGRGFYNYIRNSTFDEELVERRKNILNFNAFFNYYTYNLWKCGPYIGGFSIGYSETDNFSRLTEVSVTNTWKSQDTSGTSRSTSQKLTAFEGDYIDTIRQFKFGVDQYFVPKFLNRKIGISFNYTYNHIPNEAIKDHQDITVGVYFIKDSPFAPLQGLIFSFRDIGKQLEIPENQTRFSIGYTRQLNMYRVLKANTSEDKPSKQ